MNSAVACHAVTIAVGYDSVPTRASLLNSLRDVEDDLSWQVFFETYWKLIYSVARKSGLSDPEAQDVVQETVIAVARRLPEFRYDPAKGSFKSWLLLITRRRVQDHLRRLYRSLPEERVEQSDEINRTEQVVDPVLPPDAWLDAACEEEWRESLLETALGRLRERADPKHFQVFDLCVLQEIPARRVASMLALSTAQVYLVKHRLTRRLQLTVAELEAELARKNFKQAA